MKYDTISDSGFLKSIDGTTRKSASSAPSSPEPSSFGFSPEFPASMFSSLEDRCEEFVQGSKIYHAIFGKGTVRVNDGTYLNILFDDAKYGQMKLKAFYAIPKMMVIPN